ncbi:MAG TPA: hypothetical protein VGR73_16360 [Bryobacteraceae bacterium]|nr:hypothetical protein [Bryobacteraceae bacterium]
MKRFIHLLVVSVAAIPHQATAQLLPQQKADDLSTIIAAYDRRYAPLALASDESGFNILNAKPWIERAKATTTDAAFYELCRRYLARFGNTQDVLNLTSYQASLGFTVGFYDGVLLIDSINRSALPAAQYSFQIGDELVSLNGVTIDRWLQALLPLVSARNPGIKQS